MSRNVVLEGLDCSSNDLSSLDISNNTALYNLNCSNNRLTSLDLSRNSRLDNLYFYQNQIKGEGMDMLVGSLPTCTGYMRVIYYEKEQNVMTLIQVAAAKQKGWTAWYCTGTVYHVEHDILQEIWKEYDGVNPTGVKPIELQTNDANHYFDLDGCWHEGKPVRRGIYIVNGKKMLTK